MLDLNCISATICMRKDSSPESFRSLNVSSSSSFCEIVGSSFGNLVDCNDSCKGDFTEFCLFCSSLKFGKRLCNARVPLTGTCTQASHSPRARPIDRPSPWDGLSRAAAHFASALHRVWPNVRPVLLKAACRFTTAQSSNHRIEAVSRQAWPVTCLRGARALDHRRIAGLEPPGSLVSELPVPLSPFSRCFKRSDQPPVPLLRALVVAARSVVEPAPALADCRLAFWSSTSYVRKVCAELIVMRATIKSGRRTTMSAGNNLTI